MNSTFKLPLQFMQPEPIYVLPYERLPDMVIIATETPLYRYINEFSLYGLAMETVETIVRNIHTEILSYDPNTQVPLVNENIMYGLTIRLEGMSAVAADSVRDLAAMLTMDIYQTMRDNSLLSPVPFVDSYGDTFWTLYNYMYMTNTTIALRKIPL